MAEDLLSIYFILLKSTGETVRGSNVYRRIGILRLSNSDGGTPASPALMKVLEEHEKSLTVQLGPQYTGARRRKSSRDVVAELNRELWETETIIIV